MGMSGAPPQRNPRRRARRHGARIPRSRRCPGWRRRRLLTSVCLIDLLRVYAPRMPFEQGEARPRGMAARSVRVPLAGTRRALRTAAPQPRTPTRAPCVPWRGTYHTPLTRIRDRRAQRVFELFVSQLRGVEDVESPSYTRYTYLLERCVARPDGTRNARVYRAPLHV